MTAPPQRTAFHDPELDETMEFFKFSRLQTGYTGTVCFRLNYENGEQRDRCVRVAPNSVSIIDGQPSDGQISCVAEMTRDVFFKVYLGELPARTAVLTGSIRVHGWRFGEMSNFGDSFDARGENWDRFYAWKAAGSPELPKPEPLPQQPQQPRGSFFTQYAPDLSKLAEYAPDVSKLSDWMFRKPAVCAPDTPNIDTFTLPRDIFTPDELTQAFKSRQQHRTILPFSLSRSPSPCSNSTSIASAGFSPCTPEPELAPLSGSQDSLSLPSSASRSPHTPNFGSSPVFSLPETKQDLLQKTSQIQQRIVDTRSHMRSRMSSVVAKVLQFRDDAASGN
jgi:hypothetical protein